MKNHHILHFALAAVIITIIFGTIFHVTQQNYRQSANDPQVQLAEDTAAQLNKGARPEQPAANALLEIDKTLSPFVIIYNASDTPAFANARLNNTIPTPPTGVLEFAKERGENRVTWQPTSTLRIAAVVKPWNGGTVLVGRSLRELEMRTQKMALTIAVCWLISLIILTIAYFAGRPKAEHVVHMTV